MYSIRKLHIQKFPNIWPKPNIRKKRRIFAQTVNIRASAKPFPMNVYSLRKAYEACIIGLLHFYLSDGSKRGSVSVSLLPSLLLCSTFIAICYVTARSIN